ncbi:ACP S-malonyltransferase [Oleispirillum naphthae]|uniref:ACP S-malonyltransferase n=1 Tax=Oleispirillum naphthae TaxID=2838853 RepID=UPI0030826110
MRAVVFPGQGSQAVGMGRELAATFSVAREVFAEVEDALEQKLTQIMFEGPEQDLMMTENTQPALMAVSVAIIRVLDKEYGVRLPDAASYVAGHSLGEYSALCAAGALQLGDTARLLRTRGRAMQKAVPFGMGAMAAILGLDAEQARTLSQEASEGEICEAANDNAPGQVVVSGHVGAVKRAIEIAKKLGVKRSVLLPVSAPFHCALMRPAAETMREALAGVEMRAPSVPVVANVTARATDDPEEIRKLLVEQVCGSVRWRESVQFMKSHGVSSLVEVGSGRVLSGLARRIDREMDGLPVGSLDEIAAFAKVVAA